MRSPSAASGSSSTREAIWLAFTTHSVCAGSTCHWRATWGKAMFIMVLSITHSTRPNRITAMAMCRCGNGRPSATTGAVALRGGGEGEKSS